MIDLFWLDKLLFGSFGAESWHRRQDLLRKYWSAISAISNFKVTAGDELLELFHINIRNVLDDANRFGVKMPTTPDEWLTAAIADYKANMTAALDT